MSFRSGAKQNYSYIMSKGPSDIYIQHVDLHTPLHRRQEHVESAEGAAQARMHLHAPIRDL